MSGLLALLAVTKDGVGVAMFLIGLIGVLIFGISVLIRNHVDTLEPKTQAGAFWILCVAVILLVVALVASLQ